MRNQTIFHLAVAVCLLLAVSSASANHDTAELATEDGQVNAALSGTIGIPEPAALGIVLVGGVFVILRRGFRKV